MKIPGENILEKAINILVQFNTLDEKMKEIKTYVLDHERRIAKLEGSCELNCKLNMEKVKVALLEAKAKLQLHSGAKAT